MVEQFCDKCGTRYSMYAPACPACGEPSAQPPKKPGCPQAPAPAPKPKPAASEPSKPAEAAPSGKPTTGQDASSEGSSAPLTIEVEGKAGCPCRKLAANPLVWVGVLAAAYGIFRLIRK